LYETGHSFFFLTRKIKYGNKIFMGTFRSVNKAKLFELNICLGKNKEIMETFLSHPKKRK